MITFIFACAVMVLAALAFIAWPLLKSARVSAESSRKVYAVLGVLALVIPAIAVTFYVQLGRWNWESELASSTQAPSEVNTPEVEAMIAKLEGRLRDTPNDINGWLMLGRSYSALEKAPQAVAAYQKAYDLSAGSNTDAAMGLGEALIMVDERAIAGKAGELFEAVLVREPENVKALWYGAVGALAAGNLPRAHERLQRMLTLNPPDNIRAIIERQLQDIEQQLKAAGLTTPSTSQPAKDAQPASNRAIDVRVTLSPGLEKDLDKKTPLFVLVRDPNSPGPPLAAVRRAVGDLPLSLTITDNDAMMAGRGISSAARVQVVARISKTGAPQAQLGDLFGDATVDFATKPTADIKIVIDRVVESVPGK